VTVEVTEATNSLWLNADRPRTRLGHRFSTAVLRSVAPGCVWLRPFMSKLCPAEAPPPQQLTPFTKQPCVSLTTKA
jgi:hypothetical protein